MKTLLALFLTIFTANIFANSYLSKDEIATFYKQGYVVKKQALDLAQIEEFDHITSNLIDTILDELFKNKHSFSEEMQYAYIKGTQVAYKKPKRKEVSILRVVGCGGIDPIFLDLLRSEKMINTFFNLLDCDQLEHIICQFHPKLPNDEVSFLKHRDIDYRRFFDPDWIDIKKNGSYAVCSIAIDPSSPENGGLFIDTNSYPPDKNEKEHAVALYLEPGDMVFMHPEIVHWSTENQSDMCRRTLLTGFCVYGANHKKYPGAHVNNLLIKGEEGIKIKPAPWK